MNVKNKEMYVKLHLKEVASSYVDKGSNPYNAGINFMANLIKDMDREYMCVCNLDNHYVPINYSVVSIGTVNATFAHMRELFKTGLLSGAKQLVMMHNHPNLISVLTPSDNDITITMNAVKIGQLLGITVYDHYIVGSKGMISLKENREDLFDGNKEYLNVKKDINIPLDFKLVNVQKQYLGDPHAQSILDPSSIIVRMKYMLGQAARESQEMLYAVFIDNAGFMAGYSAISHNMTKSSMKKIIKEAFLSNSTRIAFLHFNPKWDKPPYPIYVPELEKKIFNLRKLANLSGINIVDYITLSPSLQYTSMAEVSKGNFFKESSLSQASQNMSVYERIKINNKKILNIDDNKGISRQIKNAEIIR